MFGFSFGARLVVDAAIDVSKNGKKVDRIYACDPAGPGFFHYRRDPKDAASFVQCINTSKDKGTTSYNCHQNWRFESILRFSRFICTKLFTDLATAVIRKSVQEARHSVRTVFVPTFSMPHSSMTLQQEILTNVVRDEWRKIYQTI